jgi:hypothetical protein
MLPASKADCHFEGNKVVIQWLSEDWDPHTILKRYICQQDALFSFHPWLFLTSAGLVPTHSWVITWLCIFLDDSISGHSIQSGGATFLALKNVPDEQIQAIRRWSSDTWKIYICKHPVLLQSLIWGCSTFSTTPIETSSTTEMLEHALTQPVATTPWSSHGQQLPHHTSKVHAVFRPALELLILDSGNHTRSHYFS